MRDFTIPEIKKFDASLEEGGESSEKSILIYAQYNILTNFAYWVPKSMLAQMFKLMLEKLVDPIEKTPMICKNMVY